MGSTSGSITTEATISACEPLPVCISYLPWDPRPEPRAESFLDFADSFLERERPEVFLGDFAGGSFFAKLLFFFFFAVGDFVGDSFCILK